MKILWLCNVMLPRIAAEIGAPAPVVGGWLSGAAEPILENKDDELICLFPYSKPVEGSMGNLRYFSYVENSIYIVEEALVRRFQSIILETAPDIIHIWGTEYAHSLAMAQASRDMGLLDKTFVSIQGIMYQCAEVYTLGLPKRVTRAMTLRDVVRKDSIEKQKKQFEIRASNEVEILKIVTHIIGRTGWDKASCFKINPSLNYHFCNENLRQDFYTTKSWTADECETHTVFCAQGGYPIKGLHFALQALGILKKKYPDIRLRVTGSDILHRTFIQRQKKSYYGKYLRDLIIKNGLEDNVVFLGHLNVRDMIDEYRKARIFLSPSIVENSSNAIGEAMMLSMPIIASDGGGTPDIIEDNITGYLYDRENASMLADKIVYAFENTEESIVLGQNAREKAFERHNRAANNERLMQIYHE